MAIILIHLRRIVLLVTVAYLCGTLVKKLLYGTAVRYPKINNLLFTKRFHCQLWVYLYTVYLYVVVLNCIGWNQLNVLDFFLQ
ncbi:uncharacterized protein LOC119768699 [Culex quinquefasciatus]|nr:uncharacterized protein LOC119768699 [Culex quinquefasciatus]XP_039431113.1 uncharacterized protein LOC120414140 [Culex pipiens pallens]